MIDVLMTEAPINATRANVQKCNVIIIVINVIMQHRYADILAGTGRNMTFLIVHSGLY